MAAAGRGRGAPRLVSARVEKINTRKFVLLRPSAFWFCFSHLAPGARALHSPPPPRTTILERLSQGLKRVFRKLHTQLQAAVHAFRGVPQGRAAGAWDAHAALMDRSRDRYG